jgi:hypothetical protein
LPGLPRAKLIVAAQWLVTALALWLVLHSVDLGSVPRGVATTSVMFGLTAPRTGAIVAGPSLFAGWRDVVLKKSHDDG